ncbi:TPA: ribbon-helix-helix protein, CopG family [Pseudomonas aeruginosa]|uniref:ribbon-helix-helix protein, CopG family n=1 Tax=Pseudomonas aeruginosa TaxID=287 RepID=UPI00053DABE1|nr:ribbon-helix-helix protein, CopG family [Pseudomonas aeruginosa]
MSKTRKISVSLSEQLAADLDYLSSRLGVSRSAIISQLLAEPLADTRRFFEMIPPNPTPAEIVRMRGESAELIRQRLASLQGIANDLLSKL